MRAHRLVLLLVIYVGLDFANPMMPGAVSFDPTECVEAVHCERAPAPEGAVAGPVVPAAHGLATAPRERLPRNTDGRPRPPSGVIAPAPAHAGPVESPSALEDH